VEASIISCCKEIPRQPSAGKLMLTIFWHSLVTCLECETTVTSATYYDMLQRGLKPAICSKRRGRLSDGILLLHGDACPHTAASTLETLRKLKWEVMAHAAHSPDLAPSGFQLFGLFKEAL
jgi:hypothetical protein